MDTLARARHRPKEIISAAKQWLAEQYVGENIKDIGLEEVVYENKTWKITLSFYRPRPSIPTGISSIISPQDFSRFGNAMKIVSVSDEAGEIIGMQDRILE